MLVYTKILQEHKTCKVAITTTYNAFHFQNYIFATDASKGGTAQVWFYDREKADQQGSRLGLMRQPSGIVMYDQSRQQPQPRTGT